MPDKATIPSGGGKYDDAVENNNYEFAMMVDGGQVFRPGEQYGANFKNYFVGFTILFYALLIFIMARAALSLQKRD